MMGVACRVILQEQLERLNIKHKLLELGEIEISNTVSDADFAELQASLNKYAIYIVNNEKSQLIQKNKNTIVEMIYENDKLAITISQYLSDKLNLSYGYITNVFGEHLFFY
jgi:alpha-D-ribose 1-methylphosphonate 5-triphosphate synthase subunit PhnL